MKDVNEVFLCGRVTDVKTGAKYVKLVVLTQEEYMGKSGRETSRCFHHCMFFGKFSEQAKDIAKNDRVEVQGKLSYNRYKDESGVERYLTSICSFSVKRV